MPNPWGANLGTFPPFFTNLIGSADVACGAGVETNIVSIPGTTAYGPGTWLPGFLGSVAVALGATPPTFLNIGLRINNGADIVIQSVPNLALVASATLMIPLMLWSGTSSGTQWLAPGQTLQLSLSPGAQAITAKQTGSMIYYWLMRVGE